MTKGRPGSKRVVFDVTLVNEGMESEWEDGWESFQPTQAWMEGFSSALFVTVTGRQLWQRLMENEAKRPDLLYWITCGVGSFATRKEREEVTDYAHGGYDDEGNPIVGEPIFTGSHGAEEEFRKGLSQARLIRAFLDRSRRKIRLLEKDLHATKSQRDGPIFVPSFEWPEEMSTFETALKSLIPQLEWLSSYYKPISHGSRSSTNHSGILHACDFLQGQMECNAGEVLLLLNAGLLASGAVEMSEGQLRDRVKSALQVFKT